MPHLMIGNNAALFLAENTVFLFLTHKNNFHGLKQILLAHGISPILDCQDSCLIDHVCKVRTNRTCGCQRNRL